MGVREFHVSLSSIEITKKTLPFVRSFVRSFIYSFYKMVHHSHSPRVIELNSIQLGHRHDVALLGRSYGYELTRELKDMVVREVQMVFDRKNHTIVSMIEEVRTV